MLEKVGYICLILGAVFIVLSLVFSVVWKVPTLIDNLTGRKAKRHIDRMRKMNISTGSINVSDTGNFYNTFVDDSFSAVYSTSELSKLVDDPYGTVGGKRKKVSSTSISPNLNIANSSDSTLVVLEEKSSLF